MKSKHDWLMKNESMHEQSSTFDTFDKSNFQN